MKWVLAAAVWIAALAGTDRVVFKSAYTNSLKSAAAESAAYFR